MKFIARLVLTIAVVQTARASGAGQIQGRPEKPTVFEQAVPEITATFRPEKSVYLRGEPLWFVFEVKNQGSVPLYVEHGSPYRYGALTNGYSFDVPGAVNHSGCGCMNNDCGWRSSKLLASGGTYTQRLLLDQWFLIDHPGRYRVSASRISAHVNSL